jgi:hypothetical protein
MTIAYQDLIRGKTKKRKPQYMARVTEFRHERDISIPFIRGPILTGRDQAAASQSLNTGDIIPAEVPIKLVNRAIIFHEKSIRSG